MAQAADNKTPKGSSQRNQDPNPYDSIFFVAYASNALLMIAISLLFRYYDFVKALNGDEFVLGLIVGIGTIGAIAVRILQGVGTDRLGARAIWIGSLACYSASIFLHLFIQNLDPPVVYAARVLMQCGIAGTFGASLTFVSLRVPAHRVTEVLGMHGTSGFVGMAIGPIIGDFIFAMDGSQKDHVQTMFIASGFASVLSLVCAVIATRGRIHKVPSRRLPAMRILRRYHPGMLMVVAAVMGMGLSLPGVFVRPFAGELDIEQIRLYFIVYNITAFSLRIATRKLPEYLGERKMILLGVACLACSMPTFLLVREPWQLSIPAVASGIGHAFLFPAVVASSGLHFPNRYRGVATALALGMFDVGNLIGQPILGSIIRIARTNGWPEYPIMFLFAGTMIGLAGVLYWLSGDSNHRKRRALD